MYTSDARCRMKESSSNWRASRTGPMVTSAIFEVPQHVCPRPERDELLNGSVDRVDVGHPRGICGEPGIGDQVSPAEGAEEQLGHRLRQRTRRPARRPRTCKRFAEPPRSRGWPAGGGAGRSVSIGRVRAEAAHHGVGAPSDENDGFAFGIKAGDDTADALFHLGGCLKLIIGQSIAARSWPPARIRPTSRGRRPCARRPLSGRPARSRPRRNRTGISLFPPNSRTCRASP